MFNLDVFINECVIKRSQSMFIQDIEANRDKITDLVHGKSLLVIGGAGSIGSSFIHAVLPFRPRELYVVDINENALTELTRDLRSGNGYVPDTYISYSMDYNSITFKRMFRNHKGFDIVANFSAHKHVRSEKDIYSVEALLRNNVINAKRLLMLLTEYKPNAYFCVSTDKAANPVNIMGASKRLMEDLIFTFSDSFPVKTARFANVAFSNGSLPAGFLERLAKRQPISAPSDIKRYFVSPAESGQICMLSATLGNNREIFFPRLNETQMMTFDTIAENLLKAYGYEVDYCNSDEEAKAKLMKIKEGEKYPVHFSTTDTSGEKAYEEFYAESESIDNNRFISLGVITNKPIPNKGAVTDIIATLEEMFDHPSVTKEDIIKTLSSYLIGFEHIETGKSLDDKM